MEKTSSINNAFYDDYGDRWYHAYDDPIALLRAENKTKFPWILERINPASKILDVGCGGGFLSNELALHGHDVTGVDISEESLNVARSFDKTNNAKYITADAYRLPFPDNSFDVLTAMDFLEHVDRPDDIIKEFARVLKPQGRFFFHTFNRNPISHLVVIKLLEWFIKNTPEDMHVINLFIKPSELEKYCEKAGMKVKEMTGIRPIISSIDWKMIRTGVVSENMRFTLTKSTMISYMGMAHKI